jgi:hypothetical protein
MGKVEKIRVNLPKGVLTQPERPTGKGIKAKGIKALGEIERRLLRESLHGLRGRVAFQLKLERTRR